MGIGQYKPASIITLNGAIGATTGNFGTYNTNNSGLGSIGAGFGGIASLQLESTRKMLLQDAEGKQKEATDYRDAILLRTPVRQERSSHSFIVPKGAILYPIIIGYSSDPTSFEWYIDESKECKEDWHQNIIYEVPSKHKFLDSNILPGKAYIVPIDLVLRPIDLSEDRFFFSWYGGFVVGNSK